MPLRPIPTAIIVALTFSVAQLAVAAPVIRNISLRGLQLGAPTTIVIDGEDLTPDPAIVLPLAIAAQTVKSATPTRVEIDVTVAADAVPGLYNLRLASGRGISPPIVVSVDALPQLPFAETIASLPAAVHGNLGGSSVLKTTFDGRSGEELIVEVEAQRLGGKLRPVLHLYDARNRQLAWSMPAKPLLGDTRLATKLPADGKYTIELHDAQYSGQGPGHFRLKIGRWQYADLAFPLAMPRGTQGNVALIGSLDAASPIAVNAAADLRIAAVPWPSGVVASGPRATIAVSDLPEIIEAARAADAAPQELSAAPCAVGGRLSASGERDVFRIKPAAGTRLSIELFADRVSTPVDGVIEVLNDKGAQLMRADDQGQTTDPRAEITAPADSQWLDLVVSDLHDRGGVDMVYRLVVTPLDAPPLEDFRVIMSEEPLNLAQQQSQLLPVFAERQNFGGPIRLAFDNLPAGVRVEGSEIPAGADGALITFMGDASTAAQALGVVRGTAALARGNAERRAELISGEASASLPLLRDELAIATTLPLEFPTNVEWNALADDTKLIAGDNLNLPVRFVRSFADGGPLRLSIVTSQKMPVNNQGQPEQNRALRINQQTEIGVDAPRKTAGDALAAAAKSLAEAQQKLDAAVAANQPADELKTAVAAATVARDAAAKSLAEAEAAPQDAQAILVIPSDLVDRNYDIAVRAELLSANRQRVLSSAFTKVRVLPSLASLVVTIDGAAERPVALDATGATVELVGKIERRAGLAGDVNITVENLPPGVGAPSATIKADAVDYKLELKLPNNLPPRVYTGIKVVARGRRTTNTNQMVDIRAESPSVSWTVAPAPAAP